MKWAVLAALVLVGCADGDDKSLDAGPVARGAFGAACTTVSNVSTECTSMVCTDSFDTLGHDVCSQQCTMTGATDPTCPAGSTGQKCSATGYCRP